MSENQHLVTVILCFFNEEKFIEEAIGSVRAQDYPHWELFLVDDGSSDASTRISKEYSEKFKGQIFYLQHPGHCNEGLSASRNLGIRHARGRYVAFIDADDVWFSNKLSTQVALLEANSTATVLLEPSLYWNSWADPKAGDIEIKVGVAEGIHRPKELTLKLYPLGSGAAPCPSGIMVRRELLDRIDFEEQFKGIYQMYEDQGFLGKVYLHEYVFVSGQCHNKYRQRPSSLVSSVYKDGKYESVRKYYLQWFRSYLKLKNIRDRSIWRALDKASMPFLRPFRYQLTTTLPRTAKAIAARILVKLGVLSYSRS